MKGLKHRQHESIKYRERSPEDINSWRECNNHFKITYIHTGYRFKTTKRLSLKKKSNLYIHKSSISKTKLLWCK